MPGLRPSASAADATARFERLSRAKDCLLDGGGCRAKHDVEIGLRRPAPPPGQGGCGPGQIAIFGGCAIVSGAFDLHIVFR